MRLIAGFFVVLVSAFGAAQDPVQWKLTFDSQSAPPGSKILGRLTAKIEAGWHLYSLTTPRPPIATTAVLADNAAVAGFKVYQPKAIVKLDPSFNVNTETFGEEVTFLYEIELKKDAAAGPVELTAQVRYQCCNDTMCLPPKRKTAVASVNIDPAAKAETIAIPAGYTRVPKSRGSHERAEDAYRSRAESAIVRPRLLPPDDIRGGTRGYLHALRVSDDPVHGFVLHQPEFGIKAGWHCASDCLLRWRHRILYRARPDHESHRRTHRSSETR